MLRIVFAIALVSLPLPAGAQTYAHTQTTPSGYSYQRLETSRSSLGSGGPSSRSSSPDAEQCLIRKKTGRAECHTYAEWVEIARTLDTNRK